MKSFADTRDTLCYATNDNQSAVTGMLADRLPISPLWWVDIILPTPHIWWNYASNIDHLFYGRA